MKLLSLCCRNTLKTLLKSFLLDHDADSCTYEIIGEHSEVMYSPDGHCLYLVWHFGPRDRVGIRYPKRWQGYFCRPVYLFKCPMSK